MSHNNHSTHSRHSGTTGDDLGSTDEVKVFKDEGDREDEKISSENLLVEEKSSLIDLTESDVSWNQLKPLKEKDGKVTTRPEHSSVFTKLEPHPSNFNMGYLVSPYSYTNAATAGLPVSMANKINLAPFFCHNGAPLTTPPPAHCGIPPYQLDPKAMSLTRPAIYPFPSSQYAYPMLSPDMSQMTSWHTPSMYSSASSFRSPYPSSLPINTTLSSDFPFRFSPSLLPSVHTSQHHGLNSHQVTVAPVPKQDIGQDSSNQRYGRGNDQKNSPSVQETDCKGNSNDKKKSHIKKPLNAFMLYMKEMRPKIVAECTLKESAAINQILGRRWHELTREEQSKYYEKARQERQLHMELYPGWSARSNYGYVSKKNKRKKDRSPTDPGGNNMKKCRARFGLDQQNQWCKPCRRKKKCIRIMEVDCDQDQNDGDNQMTEDNLGSNGSIDDAKTPDEDNESLNQSLSSPECYGGLFSPSTSLASPINMPASPSTPNIINNSNSNRCNSSSSSNLTISAAGMVDQQHHQQIHNLNHLSATASHQQQQQLPNLSNQHHQQLHRSNFIDTCRSAVDNNFSTMPYSAIHQMVNNAATTSLSSVKSIADRMVQSLLNNVSIGNRPGQLASMGFGVNNQSGPQIMSPDMAQSSMSENDIKQPIMLASSHIQNDASSYNVAIPSVSKCSQEDNKAKLDCKLLPPSNKNVPTSSGNTSGPPSNSSVSSTISSSSSPSLSSSSSTCQGGSNVTSASPSPSEIFFEKVTRNPVGANPRDVNNPLSINQLTKRDYNIQNNNSQVHSLDKYGAATRQDAGAT